MLNQYPHLKIPLFIHSETFEQKSLHNTTLNATLVAFMLWLAACWFNNFYKNTTITCHVHRKQFYFIEIAVIYNTISNNHGKSFGKR